MASIKILSRENLEEGFTEDFSKLIDEAYLKVKPSISEAADAIWESYEQHHPDGEEQIDFIPNVCIMMGYRLLIAAAVRMASRECEPDEMNSKVIQNVRVLAASLMKFPDLEGAGKNTMSMLNTEGSVQ